MFFNYPPLATAENWVHDSICAAIISIFNSIDGGVPVPEWPHIIPLERRDIFRAKETLPRYLNTLADEARKLSAVQRAEFLRLLAEQNKIPELLNGTAAISNISDYLIPLMNAAKAVFAEGFRLLTPIGVRDIHYRVIWEHLQNKTCPFCGLEPFDAPTLHREDEDHYLPRSKYPLAAANFSNLVPMGRKCNELYKNDVDIIRLNGARNRAFNPYGNVHADVSLNDSEPFGEGQSPKWKIDLIPDDEEARVWDNIFHVKKRLIECVLKPYYDTWLSELPDWFAHVNVDKTATDDVLLSQLDKYVAYKTKHKEVGPAFMKHKVFAMMAHHCKQGNKRLIAMIRDALPNQHAGA